MRNTERQKKIWDMAFVNALQSSIVSHGDNVDNIRFSAASEYYVKKAVTRADYITQMWQKEVDKRG